MSDRFVDFQQAVALEENSEGGGIAGLMYVDHTIMNIGLDVSVVEDTFGEGVTVTARAASDQRDKSRARACRRIQATA